MGRSKELAVIGHSFGLAQATVGKRVEVLDLEHPQRHIIEQVSL